MYTKAVCLVLIWMDLMNSNLLESVRAILLCVVEVSIICLQRLRVHKMVH